MKRVTSVLLLLLVAVQYLLMYGEHQANIHKLTLAIDRQTGDNHRLTMRNNVLKAEVMSLKTDMQAVEERARSELGMIGVGESFYQIIK